MLCDIARISKIKIPALHRQLRFRYRIFVCPTNYIYVYIRPQIKEELEAQMSSSGAPPSSTHSTNRRLTNHRPYTFLISQSIDLSVAIVFVLTATLLFPTANRRLRHQNHPKMIKVILPFSNHNQNKKPKTKNKIITHIIRDIQMKKEKIQCFKETPHIWL